MPSVEMTSHLYRFFPALKNREITVPAGSVADVLLAMDKIAPGFSDYIIDERGALRRHVMLSVNDTVLVDRATLSDRVADDATVYIFQALSGG
jgi:molybdopterin synthase sulfur carrier subunit